MIQKNKRGFYHVLTFAEKSRLIINVNEGLIQNPVKHLIWSKHFEYFTGECDSEYTYFYS